MKPSRSKLRLGAPLALVLALGAGALGCGPQKKFCPQTSNGICPEPMDASGESIFVQMDAQAEERGSIFVGEDH